MWTSERARLLAVEEPMAELGAVTLAGDPAAVSLGGERRWLNVYGPGGYCWRPKVGEKVLVVKAGAEEETPCILGKAQDTVQLAPGEVRLAGGGSAVHLGNSALELTGYITVNGMKLERYIAEIVEQVLAEQELTEQE